MFLCNISKNLYDSMEKFKSYQVPMSQKSGSPVLLLFYKHFFVRYACIGLLGDLYCIMVFGCS